MNKEKEEFIIGILLAHNYSYLRKGKVGVLKGRGKIAYFPADKFESYCKIANEREYGVGYYSNSFM